NILVFLLERPIPADSIPLTASELRSAAGSRSRKRAATYLCATRREKPGLGATNGVTHLVEQTNDSTPQGIVQGGEPPAHPGSAQTPTGARRRCPRIAGAVRFLLRPASLELRGQPGSDRRPGRFPGAPQRLHPFPAADGGGPESAQPRED